jgi:thioredoxin reductase (NADPH)
MEEFTSAKGKALPPKEFLHWLGAESRPDLAAPQLSDDMVLRLRSYGQEESFPADCTLYTHGDRNVDMFVVLEGGIDACLPLPNGTPKIYSQHRPLNFSGEFTLLNSQGAVIEARTIAPSRLLRMDRSSV